MASSGRSARRDGDDCTRRRTCSSPSTPSQCEPSAGEGEAGHDDLGLGLDDGGLEREDGGLGLDDGGLGPGDGAFGLDDLGLGPGRRL
jgi:hypothetical protein